MTISEIAAVLGATEEKLHAAFPRELKHGKAIIRAQALAILRDAGEGGNVAAAKALLANSLNDGDGPAAEKRPDDNEHVGRALRILNGGRNG